MATKTDDDQVTLFQVQFQLVSEYEKVPFPVRCNDRLDGIFFL